MTGFVRKALVRWLWPELSERVSKAARLDRARGRAMIDDLDAACRRAQRVGLAPRLHVLDLLPGEKLVETFGPTTTDRLAVACDDRAQTDARLKRAGVSAQSLATRLTEIDPAAGQLARARYAEAMAMTARGGLNPKELDLVLAVARLHSPPAPEDPSPSAPRGRHAKQAGQGPRETQAPAPDARASGGSRPDRKLANG